MAVIKSFKLGKGNRVTLHPTQVVATVYYQEYDGRKILQIDTHGSDDREIPDKVSQTIQLDESSAQQLFDLLKKDFGFR
ncbi:methionyl-tRNA formyltransferase [Hoeflea sp.]|uniref:methionyl-tRNA formyltransferase n=1 Tax=Hoeflea sp. TaxID=1940281 RepID=UPI00198B2356|nr:methionyl-tRNA formyltransferase [Hoeflea sp.]MBC7284541.1 methionyl-tRNA formyltransferase [Hoeflea sp.]